MLAVAQREAAAPENPAAVDGSNRCARRLVLGEPFLDDVSRLCRPLGTGGSARDVECEEYEHALVGSFGCPDRALSVRPGAFRRGGRIADWVWVVNRSMAARQRSGVGRHGGRVQRWSAGFATVKN